MSDSHRTVTLSRLETGVYQAVNPRGGTLRFGSSAGQDFTPVELLLAAIGGCSAVDVDVVTSRRAEPEQFEVQVTGDVLRGEDGNVLEDLVLTFRLQFPAGEAGDAARAVLPRAVEVSHTRTCTVGRTVELGREVRVVVEHDTSGTPGTGGGFDRS